MRASDIQIGGSHYKDFAIQPAEFIHRNGIGFLEGNIIKYVCRHATKGGRQDLEKAKHYLDMLLQWEYDERNKVEVAICGRCGELMGPEHACFGAT